MSDAERVFGVYVRFIEPVEPGQDKFDAIAVVEQRVRDLPDVDEIWSEGRVASQRMPEEQATVEAPERTCLVLVRFIEQADDADSAASAVAERLRTAGLDPDEVFTAAEYDH